MRQTSQTHEQNPQDSRRGSLPWPLILIVTTIVVPIVGAYIAYYTGMGVSEGTVNKGILLEPAVKVSDLIALSDSDELPGLTERKWHLLVPVTGPCEDGCQKNLYTTRQVHIRLGDKSTRVDRWAVNLAGASGESFLEDIHDDHPFLKHFSVTPEVWRHWLGKTNIPASLEQTPYYLLVDQEGFAMMYYTVDHHGNELLDDIKRVLRYTPE